MLMSAPDVVSNRKLDIREIAVHLKSSRSTVDELVRRGLPCVDVAPPGRRRRRLRFDLAEVNAWLSRRRAA
jgi:predicted DNA-binding transcriptional regulator AlpA